MGVGSCTFLVIECKWGSGLGAKLPVTGGKEQRPQRLAILGIYYQNNELPAEILPKILKRIHFSTISVLSGLRLSERQPHRTVRTTAARNKHCEKY